MRKWVALTVLFAFGCATVRAPAGSVEQAIGPLRGVVAEPQIELWLESGEPISAEEKALGQEQAREALQQALDSRAISPSPLGAQDPVLVVRERGISRTASRKRDQVGATIALAVGVVVVIAVIVAVAASGSKSSPKVAVPKAAPATAAPVASVAKAHPRAIPGPPKLPPPRAVGGPAPGPYVGYPQPWPWFDFYLYAQVPPRPLYAQSTEDLGAPPPPEPDGEEPAMAEPPPLELPPPPPFDFEDRGFFSGDDTVVQFDLLDRATGKLLWSKEAHGGDPRDPDDMRRMVNEALDGAHWAQRVRTPERASR